MNYEDGVKQLPCVTIPTSNELLHRQLAAYSDMLVSLARGADVVRHSLLGGASGEEVTRLQDTRAGLLAVAREVADEMHAIVKALAGKA